MFVLFFSQLCLLASSKLTTAYWEIWDQTFTNEFASSVSSIPVSSLTNSGAAQDVHISFADYGFTTDSSGNLLLNYLNSQVTSTFSVFGSSQLSSSVSKVQSKGGKVSVSFGGATFSMANTIQTSTQASKFSSNVVSMSTSHGLNGVEFSHVSPNDGASIFANVINGIKALSSTLQITYTIPGTGAFSSPWKDVITNTKNNLDFVQIMAYDTYKLNYQVQNDINQLIALGVSASKIIIGLMPGCHDEPFNITTQEDVINAASIVKGQGLAGIALWSANRDTNHRTSDNSCLFQTGLSDGFFIALTSLNI